MLPVPRLEAFALPIVVKRATRNPRRCVYMISLITVLHTYMPYICPHTANASKDSDGNVYKTSHGHLPLPCPGLQLESCEVSNRQEQSAKVNAFQYSDSHIPFPPPLPGEVPAVGFGVGVSFSVYYCHGGCFRRQVKKTGRPWKS